MVRTQLKKINEELERRVNEKGRGYPAFFFVGKSSNQFVILGSSGEPS